MQRVVNRVQLFQFLSTPSARRATVKAPVHLQTAYISIHALREEGDLAAVQGIRQSLISIHALREEGDQKRKETR